MGFMLSIVLYFIYDEERFNLYYIISISRASPPWWHHQSDDFWTN